MIETLTVDYECYMMIGKCFDNPEELEAVGRFVDWVIKEKKKDLVCKRGKSGESFQDIRNDKGF